MIPLTSFRIPIQDPVVLDMQAWDANVASTDLCIFCEPESSRVIFETSRYICIAGAGPIRRGYSIIAPKEHLPTVAELDVDLFVEFEAAERLLVSALARAYGPSYTAYEHGRVGSCRWAELRNATGHHCFHAHRVYVPGTHDISQALGRMFSNEVSLAAACDLLRVREPYIFFECADSANASRRVFTRPGIVQSQCVRRLLAHRLATPHRWDWARFPEWPVVLETVTTLRGALRAIPLQASSAATVLSTSNAAP